MNFELAVSILALLQASRAEPSRISEKDITLKQWTFAKSPETRYTVEEPRFEDEKYSIAACNVSSDRKNLTCAVELHYRIYDDVWYNRSCPMRMSAHLGQGRIGEPLRLTSLGSNDKLLSYRAYDDDEAQLTGRVELKLVRMRDCATWRSNRVVVATLGAGYDLLPYGSTFDYIIKTNISFQNGSYFKLSMNDNGQTFQTGIVRYERESLRGYRSVEAYPMDATSSSRSYFFVYDFGDVVKALVADERGKIDRGKDIFKRHSNESRYEAVASAQGYEMLAVCARLLVGKAVNGSCALLDESLGVRFNGSYVSAVSEQLLAVSVLKSGDILLATVNSRVSNATFLFDKISTQTGVKERLFELRETSCDAGQTVKFGRVYELTNDVCFSTYCSDSALKKWNARCFDKNLLSPMEAEEEKKEEVVESVRIVYVTSNTMVFAVLGISIIIYLVLFVCPTLGYVVADKNA